MIADIAKGISVLGMWVVFGWMFHSFSRAATKPIDWGGWGFALLLVCLTTGCVYAK